MEIIEADVDIALNEAGKVTGFGVYPKYHFHLYCSEKGDHAGYKKQHSEQMKVDKLPNDIWEQIWKEEQ